MTYYDKAKIDKTQQNSKCKLCGDRDETINHVMRECSKLARKEYKTRRSCYGKVIHLELSKKLKFDHTNKWYIHNSESVLENEMHKLLWDFEIQTDPLISARRPDLLIVKRKKRKKKKKRTCRTVDLAIATDQLKEFEKRDKYLDLAWELKQKIYNMKLMVILILIGALRTIPKGLVKELEDLEIRGQVETIQTTALLRSARILTRVLETWRDLLSLKLSWENISKGWCENFWKEYNNYKAAQNNAMRINNLKAKIDGSNKNYNRRLCGDKRWKSHSQGMQ